MMLNITMIIIMAHSIKTLHKSMKIDTCHDSLVKCFYVVCHNLPNMVSHYAEFHFPKYQYTECHYNNRHSVSYYYAVCLCDECLSAHTKLLNIHLTTISREYSSLETCTIKMFTVVNTFVQ
jgi:hypothetical protein